ncbi:Hypothetical predicted protein [Paramuricea clavata]|uniref:Uncharacterized protein n=1 Tax=Paramuricea clavata TaxID=317549 RepID=A0A7D9J8X9_PARCT|nr:Hypothetical predicted protein [Paramuricea clavata]
MKTMRDYHDLYLETDVLLLADVFENFKRTCLESYELDPAHYVSAPSLSWDAFLKKSGEEIELVSDMDMFQFFEKDDLLKLTASPCFQSHRIMNQNLIVVKRMKEVLTLNKPCYVGMSILDLSKTLMYDFHYNTITKEHGNSSRLLFTDTDSLMYELKTDDVYEDFKRIGEEQDCWDNSDYPKDSPYYSTHNKKVIGKFKDEAGGVPIIEFVGLRSKMYSYVKENGGGGMTAKGKRTVNSWNLSVTTKMGTVEVVGSINQCSELISDGSVERGVCYLKGISKVVEEALEWENWTISEKLRIILKSQLD